MSKKEIVLGVTGSIAIYKALDLIGRLKGQDFNVTVIMTQEAQELIKPLTFQAISGNQVYVDMFIPLKEFNPSITLKVNLQRSRGVGPAHISLAKKAKIILICPATANIIGKLAHGICDDLLTTTVISTAADTIICPAMNENMYKNSIVQENIAKLKKSGIEFVPPVKGKLACGAEGIGRLAPLEAIIKAVIQRAK